jgi:hypothetical protein
MKSDGEELAAPLTLGHENVDGLGGAETEYRARLIFDVGGQFELPPGLRLSEFACAQIIVGFMRDSVAWNEPGYVTNDTDTGLMTIHAMTASTRDLWNASYFESARLGEVDLPPHIIPDPPAQIRSVPLPQGAPISFGHEESLKTMVRHWVTGQRPNYGVLVKAERLGTANHRLSGDQHVHFQKQAILRLTFDRTRP